jgi:hypothetical protein
MDLRSLRSRSGEKRGVLRQHDTVSPARLHPHSERIGFGLRPEASVAVAAANPHKRHFFWSTVGRTTWPEVKQTMQMANCPRCFALMQEAPKHVLRNRGTGEKYPGYVSSCKPPLSFGFRSRVSLNVESKRTGPPGFYSSMPHRARHKMDTTAPMAIPVRSGSPRCPC